MNPMIKLKNFDLLSPEKKVLLKNFNFETQIPEHVLFYGPNGCGKSTLLRYLAGLERQDQSKKCLLEILPSDIAYIPTNPLDLLLPWASVAENINMFEQLAKKKAGILDGVNSWNLLNYDLKSLERQSVYSLSSGQQAILAISCALIKSVNLVIADEVFATLSDELISQVAQVFKQLQNLGVGLICTSHDQLFIDKLNAKVIKLKEFIP